MPPPCAGRGTRRAPHGAHALANRHLLIVYHTQSGNTGRLAEAVCRGAGAGGTDEVEVRRPRAFDAGVAGRVWADAVLLGTPENFGYMSGGMKDFLDRTYYPCEGRREGLPFAIFISAGNDGRGAVEAIRRIARGFPLREVHDPVIARGEVTPEHLAACEALGQATAAGLELGIL